VNRDERARWLGGTLIAVLVAAGGTHLYESRVADARVLAAHTADAEHLADAQETSARASIALQSDLAACELERRHARESAPIRGDVAQIADVREATGATTVRAGSTCNLELDWDTGADELPCRALIRCGTTRVYGDVGSGFFGCTVDAHGPIRGEDTNPTSDGGDPRILVDRATRTIVVSDDAPAWSITLHYFTDEDEETIGETGL
jgi:hypothetical protein